MTGTLLRAAWVVPVASPPIRDGYVLVREGRVVEVDHVSKRPASALAEVDLGSTVLLPGFVNAHTHLELSHLAGAVSGDRGFVPWIEDQLKVRAERPPAEVEPAIERAIAGMEARGTTAVADVSNTLAAVKALVRSNLSALVLHEILGVDPEKAGAISESARKLREGVAGAPPRVRIGVAAHAPHSISRELFGRLGSFGVSSIHVAESASETQFLSDGSGDWRGFLDRRVGPVPFAPPRMSPVRYLDALGVLTPGILAVHCVRVDEDDARLLVERRAVAVLCPRSNRFLGNGLPPAALLAGSGVALAFGTDSLASCPSLDVLEDARLIARSFPRLPREVIIDALTRGGARALGFDDLGVIERGALARFAAIDFAGDPPADPLAFVLEDQAAARSVVAWASR